MYLFIQDLTQERKMMIEMKKKAQKVKNKVHNDIRKALVKKNACYVLITCGVPSKDGKMEVEMTYEGDTSLASFLIESAYGILENQEVVEST